MTRRSVTDRPYSALNRMPRSAASSVDVPRSAGSPRAVSRPATIRTVQVGMHWTAGGAGSGVDRVFHALVHQLPRHDVTVDGLVVAADAEPPAGIHTLAAPDASLVDRLRALRDWGRQHLSDGGPDLVATHFPLYAAPLLDLMPPRPLVVHFHGPWALESKAEGESWGQVRAKRWLERRVYRRGTRFIVLSKAFQQLLTEEYGVDPERIHIVPGGVDLERFAVTLPPDEARRRLGWDPDRPTLLSVRRLVQRVGLEPLVDAMRLVARAVPDAQLLIAGKGPLAPALKQRIDANGLRDTVRLLGFVPDADLPLAYAAADASVVPTQALEGFGLVAAESLAAGTPAFVTPVGGLPDVVAPLSPDLVMADTTESAIAARLIAALRGTLNVPTADACRRYAAERFDWAVVARTIRSVYEDALSNPRS